MTYLITMIVKSLVTTIIVLLVAYLLGNLILPIFNFRLDIKIKLYKAKKAL